MEITGDDLKRARKAAGLSQEQAARALHVAIRTYAPWETAGVPPRDVGNVRALFWPPDGVDDYSIEELLDALARKTEARWQPARADVEYTAQSAGHGHRGVGRHATQENARAHPHKDDPAV